MYKYTRKGHWTRWTSEYLQALREQHNLKHKSYDILISKGGVVLIKSNKKNDEVEHRNSSAN